MDFFHLVSSYLHLPFLFLAWKLQCWCFWNQTLYDNGGRRFWVHNTGPLGCLPQKLALPRKDDSVLDKHGCLIHYNNAAKEFNARLSILCDELSSKLKNATIVYTDIYALKYDLIANYTKYGKLKNATTFSR